ncbi:hypothetical protein EP331_02730, partial [bacterium]
MIKKLLQYSLLLLFATSCLEDSTMDFFSVKIVDENGNPIKNKEIYLGYDVFGYNYQDDKVFDVSSNPSTNYSIAFSFVKDNAHITLSLFNYHTNERKIQLENQVYTAGQHFISGHTKAGFYQIKLEVKDIDELYTSEKFYIIPQSFGMTGMHHGITNEFGESLFHSVELFPRKALDKLYSTKFTDGFDQEIKD